MTPQRLQHCLHRFVSPCQFSVVNLETDMTDYINIVFKHCTCAFTA